MRLVDEQVVCLRKTSDNWCYFDEQSGIVRIPKREVFNMIPEGYVGYATDLRVFPQQRTKLHHAHASRWATYTAIIQLFIESKHDWLLLIEEDVQLSTSDIVRIESTAKPNTLTILHEHAWLMDKTIAKIIVRNLRLYYAPIDAMLNDLEKLDLIKIDRLNNLSTIKKSYILLHYIGPLIVSILMCIGIYLMLNPPDCLVRAKEFISSAKVAAAKEAFGSGKWAGVSGLKDVIVAAQQAPLGLSMPTP